MRLVLLALLAAAAAVTPAAESPAAERARIAAERSRVEAQFQGEERACWGKFAVNDCLAQARAKRRSALADLRRQEISLNDAERKRRAAERLRSIEQGPDPVAPPAAAPPRVRDGSDASARDAKAAQRAAEQAARQAEHARRSKAKPDSAGRAGEELARREAERASRAGRAAENVRRREALQREAKERQEALQRRLAARHKPPAAPLPLPP